ncbi:quinone oxidoreductase family protein [Pseudoxanthomonas sacheonensis]|uniref:quinone oxidoreductase family protein n=1 Tax=Pseudoxanthomonas sacheonensis TaxID=443615 RepID=UPI0013D8429B|nr:quinone oxidoreductase [Pseudoxanthomonas sacheonensis]KAF1707497.1 alcohol dehydrogenase [Pseudoxanthomonas sacheonensis]
MHALTFSRFGGPEVLEWTTLPDPQPAPGVVVVRTRAIGLNFADVYRRQGRYHLAGSPPWIAGYEAAGEIVAIHPQDAGGAFAIGRRVAFADSAFANAELVAVPLDRLIALPDDIDFETAAALLLQGLTAQFLLEDSHAVRAGETLLVHAAGGGVGQLLVQLATAKGANVIALASSEDKRRSALAAGARHALDSGLGWAGRVRAVAPDGVDVVYDSIGRTLGDSLALARTGGTAVFYGMAAGDPDPVDPRVLMDRSLTLVGGDLWNVLTTAQERQQRADRLFEAVHAGQLRVSVAAHIPLREGAQAHALLEGRGSAGKVLLIP